MNIKQNCPDEQTIYMFLDVELPVEGMRAVLEHLQTCHSCMEILKASENYENALSASANAYISATDRVEPIMKEVRKLASFTVEDASEFTFFDFLKTVFSSKVFRYSAAAFVSVIFLSFFFMAGEPESTLVPVRKTVSAYSMMAAGSDAFIDGEKCLPGVPYNLDSDRTYKISGRFAVYLPGTSVITLDAQDMASFTYQSSDGLLVLETENNVRLTSPFGDEFNAKVNGAVVAFGLLPYQKGEFLTPGDKDKKDEKTGNHVIITEDNSRTESIAERPIQAAEVLEQEGSSEALSSEVPEQVVVEHVYDDDEFEAGDPVSIPLDESQDTGSRDDPDCANPFSSSSVILR
ncbi:MAG: hypothetical protein GX221_06390 [Candidatus Riflebacteria bacterium]|nr:hypothetical protein [Candidatus Riflebacteria bacterium]